jgi:hypothetical protein
MKSIHKYKISFFKFNNYIKNKLNGKAKTIKKPPEGGLCLVAVDGVEPPS